MSKTALFPPLRRAAGTVAIALSLAGVGLTAGLGAASAQIIPPPPGTRPPNYVPTPPAQNLAPPAPRQNVVPALPPTTRPGEGDASQRIQGGSTRRMPLPNTQQ